MISNPPGAFQPPAPYIDPGHPDYDELRARPAILVPFVTTAANLQLIGGAGIIAGMVIREMAGAAATLDIYDGSSAAGVLIAPVSLAAAGMFAIGPGDDGPFFRSGIFINMLTGSVKGSFWIKYRA